MLHKAIRKIWNPRGGGKLSDNEQVNISQESAVEEPAIETTLTEICEDKKMYPLAITTNLLCDVALTPNIGIKVPVGTHLTVGADWMYARWHRASRHRYWHLYGGNLDVQYRIGNVPERYGRFAGHHIGVYASMSCYDFQFGEHTGVLSDKYNYAAGISYTYSMPVARRLNIEFGIGIGCLWGRYKKHHPIDDHDVWLSTHNLQWVGPTRAGISLVWTVGGKEGDLNRKGGGR